MRATNIGFHVFALSGIWAGAMEPLSPVSSHPDPEPNSSSLIARPVFPQRTPARQTLRDLGASPWQCPTSVLASGECGGGQSEGLRAAAVDGTLRVEASSNKCYRGPERARVRG